MDNLCLLSFLAICSYAFATITISDLVVPQELQHGKQTDIILDCKFKVENSNDTSDLVIKWYFQEKQLIYQWIPGKEPQALGILKDKIDLTYKASNDSYTKYRALKITNITTDLTGAYTCQVSSLYNEATGTKQMTIYEPPKHYLFNITTNSSEFLCSAFEVFPKPLMKVYPYGVNFTRTDYDVVDVEEEYGEESPENLLYNVSITATYDTENITEPTVFFCDIIIPNTHFRKVLNRTFYPEGEPTTTTSDYDYETTTISPTSSDNSGCLKEPSTILLSTFVLTFLLRHL